MATEVQEMKKILAKLPKDASYGDMRYELELREKVERGLKSVREGKGIPHDQVVKNMKKWRAK